MSTESARAFVSEVNADKFSHVSINTFRTKEEQALHQKRRGGWPHVTPGSVYIAAIGRRWEPGCWQRVVDMKEFTNSQGIMCWLEEQPDSHSTFPEADVSGMRDEGIYKGLDGGFEWICFVDNDVEVPPDFLCRFTRYGLPIVAPTILDNKTGIPVCGPIYKLGQGLVPMQWVSLSLLLVKAAIFNCPGTRFSNVSTEGRFFQNLWHYGHQPWMDTDVEVKTTRGPTRPGDLSWDVRWDALKSMYGSRDQKPDRGATRPNNPHEVDGMYVPFLLDGKR